MTDSDNVQTQSDRNHLALVLTKCKSVWVKRMGVTQAGYHKFLVLAITHEGRLVDITQAVSKIIGKWTANGTMSAYLPAGAQTIRRVLRELVPLQDLEVEQV